MKLEVGKKVHVIKPVTYCADNGVPVMIKPYKDVLTVVSIGPNYTYVVCKKRKPVSVYNFFLTPIATKEDCL